MPSPQSSIVVGSALAPAALDGRGGWTWAFGGDVATRASWPTIATAATAAALLPAGDATVYIHLPTLGVDALGAGSVRFNEGVSVDGASAWAASGYPNPAANPILFRLLLRDPQPTGPGISTYLELAHASQRLTLRRSDDAYELIGNLGVDTRSFLALDDWPRYTLLDVKATAMGFVAYVNGVDATPLLAPVTLSAFAGAPTLTLLATTGVTDVARGTTLVFAGLATSPALTLDQHRLDASALGVRADGLAIALGDWYWAWSGNRLDATGLPGEPDYGGEGARLSSVTVDAATSTSTTYLGQEGIGRERLERAVTGDLKAASSGTPLVSGDLHVRLIFRLDDDGYGRQLFKLGDFAITVSLNGDLTIDAPSSYSATFVGAVLRDSWTWHLLDVCLQRDDGGGNALFFVQLDGHDIAAAPFAGPVDDIPAGSSLFLGGGGTFVFAGFALDRILDLARHQYDACALRVFA